ncbi:MAG: TIGR03560 family F420-dependent LLM class oxidoreductase [Acidimicrobiia bacterium]|nr:TIGR03560 family F420-dependent LLM class oxidoreductase [Acidimicrobiia bacterium]
MRFSFWIPNSLPWSETLDLGRRAEELGYDGLWYADHFMPNEPEPADGPVHEAFTILAALAASVPRVRIGPLVAGNTYRNPAVLAKICSAIDHVSGGRMVVGLGAGWQENEHRAYGLEFNSFSWRFDRLEEACEILRGLFGQQRTDFSGRHYTMVSAPLDPKPVQAAIPLLVGGGGPRRTLPIVARFADEWNVWGEPDLLAEKGALLDRCCEDAGRDPAEVDHSAVALVFLTDDQPTIDKLRGRDLGRPRLIGTPSEMQEMVGAYAQAGVDEFIVPAFNFRSAGEREETMVRFVEEVAAPFRD